MPARAPSSTRTLLFQGLIDEPHYLLDGTGHLPGLGLNVALFAWNSAVQFRWDAFRPGEGIPHDLFSTGVPSFFRNFMLSGTTDVLDGLQSLRLRGHRGHDHRPAAS